MLFKLDSQYYDEFSKWMEIIMILTDILKYEYNYKFKE